MIPLIEIRILPPLAIARLGSAAEPVNNYDLEVSAHHPLGFRAIVEAPTLVVDEATGAIAAHECRQVTFKDPEGRIRPVAPFLELWGRTAPDAGAEMERASERWRAGAEMERASERWRAGAEHGEENWRQLTMHDLKGATIRWRATLGNSKVFRRTGDVHDKILATTGWFSGHARMALEGRADNFLPGKHIPFGDLRYIRPTDEFPQIRVRYTPGHGYVYGSDAFVRNADGTYATDPLDYHLQPDANLRDVVLDSSKSRWLGFNEQTPPNTPPLPTLTIPPRIFAGRNGSSGGDWISRGYLDDQCDGVIEVEVHTGETTLRSFARLCAGPPAFVPDSYSIRTVYDELEQALLGPTVDPDDYTDDELQAGVEEILRRTFETVRLMNTTIMNGNAFRGQLDLTPTMVQEDRKDTARAWEPFMAPALVDNLAVQSLHQDIFAVLRSGVPPWFTSTLRQFDEIGDLTDRGRRKMPAMMRNTDGRYLCLTRRQYDKIRLAATRGRSRRTIKETP